MFKNIVKLILYITIFIYLLCNYSYTFEYEHHRYIVFKRGLLFGIVEDPDCPYCLSKFD